MVQAIVFGACRMPLFLDMPQAIDLCNMADAMIYEVWQVPSFIIMAGAIPFGFMYV